MTAQLVNTGLQSLPVYFPPPEHTQTHTTSHTHTVEPRGGNHRETYDSIQYALHGPQHDNIAIKPIISRYSGSAIINILFENPLMIHHNICLTMNTM